MRLHRGSWSLALAGVLLTGACSSGPSAPSAADPSQSSAGAPETSRAEFEEFFRMSLRQVPAQKLDCMLSELDTSLTDEQAAEFIKTLSAGDQPSRPTLEAVSAAAAACRATLPT